MMNRDFSTEWEETTDFLGTPHASLVWQTLRASENFELDLKGQPLTFELA